LTSLLPSAIRIELPYPPSTNRYWRMFRSRMVVSAEAKAYKEHAAWLAREDGLRTPIDGPVALRAVLRPKKPLRPSKGRAVRCIDIDNALKVAVDALNGVAYLDDSQLVDLRISRGEACAGGALEVTVMPSSTGRLDFEGWTP
jgi:crossover junction endodeoxyribonuclease RusA